MTLLSSDATKKNQYCLPLLDQFLNTTDYMCYRIIPLLRLSLVGDTLLITDGDPSVINSESINVRCI
jgi:hypothetical protein